LVDVGNPRELTEGLLRKGIAVKSYARALGALSRCVRISLGTPDENTALLAAIAALLA
jgi:histidinol-phosphate/aromatic aminotransferase/cobyric acid decarboxylase-like protein